MIQPWPLFHRLLNEFPWASPEVVGRMTLADAMACFADKPPATVGGTRAPRATTPDEVKAMLRRHRARQMAWEKDPEPEPPPAPIPPPNGRG